MRKLTRKGLVRALDTTVSLYVRKRDGRCFTCGTSENLSCGHLFTRGLYIVRWDLTNCHAQCIGCNYRHEFDPSIYQLKFIDKYGLETYRELYRKAHKPNKFSDKQLREMLEEIKELEKELNV